MKKYSTLISLVLYLVLCLVLVPGQAAAYIDPSTTSYLVQALIGVGVAVVAGVSIYWRNAKKKVSQKLGMDEKEKKNAESDDIEVK